MLKNHYAKFIPEDRPNMGQLISEMIKDRTKNLNELQSKKINSD